MRLRYAYPSDLDAIFASEQLTALHKALKEMPSGYSEANVSQFYYALTQFLKRLNRRFPHDEPISCKLTRKGDERHLWIFRKGCKSKEKRHLYHWEFIDMGPTFFPEYFFNRLCSGAGMDEERLSARSNRDNKCAPMDSDEDLPF